MKKQTLMQTFFLLLLLFRSQPVATMPKTKTITTIKKQSLLRPYLCDSCTKSFSHNYLLTAHKKTHEKKKLFPCHLCTRSFSHKGTRTTHQQVKHKGEECYKCNLCDNKFMTKFILRMHHSRHTNEKLYECTLCYENFYQKGSLTRHVKRYHSQNNNFVTPSTSIIQPTTFHHTLTKNYSIMMPEKKSLLTNINEPVKPLYEPNGAAKDPNLLEWIEIL